MGVCTKTNQKIDPRIITSYYSKPEGCQKARYHDIPADFLDMEDDLDMEEKSHATQLVSDELDINASTVAIIFSFGNPRSPANSHQPAQEPFPCKGERMRAGG